MTLTEKLTQDYQQAMKDKQYIAKLVLNFILSQVKNKKIELQKDPEDDEVIWLIKKQIKSLDEAIVFLEKAGKTSELEEEKQKKQILMSYLPATMSREETSQIIDKLIIDLDITDLKTGRGLLMKELMANYKSSIDWWLVNDIINSRLNS